jgi:hypothetical protein
MTAGDVITIVEDNVARKGNYFDGTDDYVLHDAHAIARVAANDTTGTYTAWIYANSSLMSGTILSGGDLNADEYLQFLMDTGKLNIKVVVAGITRLNVSETTVSISPRTWTHVAVVQNGTRPILYVNGSAVAMTDTVATSLSEWYDETTGIDKFCIGVLGRNGTYVSDWNGAIGQVKYWSRALSAAEILQDYNGEALYDDATYLQFNVTMADNGTTDSGLGADDGTLTGDAHYGGYISAHSIALERNCTGHAAERSTTMQISPSKLQTVIVRGD